MAASRKSSISAVLRSANGCFCLLFLAISLTLVPPSSWAWQGKVVGVSDGDTITVMHEGKGETIRLYGIDCPESGQDFGQKAKHFTSTEVFGKTVEVTPITVDRYGRTVGMVSADGKALNRKIIEAGYAWLYEKYCSIPECKEWRQVEASARKQRVGLWSIPNPIPPWDFRHAKRTTTSAPIIKNEPRKENQSTLVFHGNVSSRIFHGLNCRYYNCKNCTASFKSRDEAMSAGYRTCKICKP